MPSRVVVAKEMGDIFRVISHPDRIRLIEELRVTEKDVNTLATALDLPGPRVSQHLSQLRARRIVEERRDGRHHYYSLTQPDFATWIIAGLSFVEGQLSALPQESIKAARQLWMSDAADPSQQSGAE